MAVGSWQINRSWFTALLQSGCMKGKDSFSLLSVKHSMYLNKKQEQNREALKMHELTARIGEGETERGWGTGVYSSPVLLHRKEMRICVKTYHQYDYQSSNQQAEFCSSSFAIIYICEAKPLVWSYETQTACSLIN